jgi:hypothetical protein
MMKNATKSAELIDHSGQTGFVAIGVFSMDQVLGRSLVQQAGGGPKLLDRFVLVVLSAEILDGYTHGGPESSVSEAAGFRSLHPLGTRFMSWQYRILSSSVNNLAF